MKKNLLLAIAATGFMYSCGGGPSKEELKKAADKICDCMATKTAERGEVNEALVESTTNMDYALCGLDLAFSGIDASTDEFTAAVAEHCPDLKDAQVAYAKTLKEE